MTAVQRHRHPTLLLYLRHPQTSPFQPPPLRLLLLRSLRLRLRLLLLRRLPALPLLSAQSLRASLPRTLRG